MAGTSVYVLELEGGHFYVGKTTDLDQRLAEHMTGYGSAWTSLHPTTGRYAEHRAMTSDFDEDNVTKEYMRRHGIDKVRGGVYTQTVLPENLRGALQLELWGSEDLCLRCGRADHFVRDCHETTRATGEPLPPVGAAAAVAAPSSSSSTSSFVPSPPPPNIVSYLPPSALQRGRASRAASSPFLYVPYDVNAAYNPAGQPFVFGALPELSVAAAPRKRNAADAGLEADQHEPRSFCFRCRRGGHSADECYAGTRSDGSILYSSSGRAGGGAARPAPHVFAASPQPTANSAYAPQLRQAVSPQIQVVDRSFCFRCRRGGHSADECYAGTRSDGSVLFSSRERENGGRTTRGAGGTALYAPREPSFAPSASSKCYRCRRTGHLVADCYAKSDASGRSL
jgi:predicted GIY-YIG superfamily endonuclease